MQLLGSMLTIAAVPPLPVPAKVVGSLMGVTILAASFYLLGRHPREESTDSSMKQAYWRKPNAIFLAVIGVSFLFGTWINPARNPFLFVTVWMGVMLATVATFGVAIYDLMFIRKRAIEDRVRLLKQNRDELERDLKEYYRSRAHKSDGTPS